MVGEHDRGRTDPCAKHNDGERTLGERTDANKLRGTLQRLKKLTALFQNRCRFKVLALIPNQDLH